MSDVPGAPGRLRFAHVLIRDTLYDGLTSARRMRLHGRVVEALEALYGEEPGVTSPSSRTTRSPGRDRARGAATRGAPAIGRWRLLAYEEAAQLWTALDALGARPADGAGRCELLLALGEAELRAGTLPAAKQAFLDAAGIARLGLPRELAARRPGYGGRFMWARPAATTGSCRCSRRASPRSATRTSSCGRGCSPGWRERCATSTRASAATA